MRIDYHALDTADLDRTRVHLANCIECHARIYEGDHYRVTVRTDEFYCDEHKEMATYYRGTRRVRE